jgi:hypothetical protein
VQLNISVYSAGKMTGNQTFEKEAYWLVCNAMLHCFTLKFAKSWHCVLSFCTFYLIFSFFFFLSSRCLSPEKFDFLSSSSLFRLIVHQNTLE